DGVEVGGQQVEAAVVHHRLDQRGVDVGEELRQLRLVALDVCVEGDPQVLGRELLDALGGHGDDVGRLAGGHHGQELDEERVPVGGRDVDVLKCDVGVFLFKERGEL